MQKLRIIHYTSTRISFAIAVFLCVMAIEAKCNNPHDIYAGSYFDGYVGLLQLNPNNTEVAFRSKTRARLYSVAAIGIPTAFAIVTSRGYQLSRPTGSSILMMATGWLIGPSTGSIYADDWQLARRSMAIRAIGAAVIISGYVLSENGPDIDTGRLMQIAGAGFLAGHAIYDTIVLSAHSVEYHNLTLKIEAGISFWDMNGHYLNIGSASAMADGLMSIPRIGIVFSL